jgi:deoxyribose-phosphate aldolase
MPSSVSVDQIASYIDHTNVKADATRQDIRNLCDEALKYKFHSVCVTPHRVKDAKGFLSGSDIKIICVIGFPFGFTTTAEKINEGKVAVSDGATEIDMVINIGAIKDNDFDFIENEIRQIAEAIKPIGLKVITEVGFLTPEELDKACRKAKSAGVAFVKTSTGYGPRTPTVEDIKIMRQAVGPEIGVKASGGIHTLEQANQMVEAGATRIGTSSALQIIGVETEKKEDLAGSNE